MHNDNIESEAGAFDTQIRERIENGHIPDLRYTEKCDYFYNNPWRHPEYVKLDLGEQFTLMNSSIREYFSNRDNTTIRILEIGCGPGHMSLEFSRAGYNVTGIDVSAKCIEIAKHFAAKDPLNNERGELNYFAEDLFNYSPSQKFDVVIFLGALHHFKEQQQVMTKVKELLYPDGLILAHEPTRDRITEGNAAFFSFLKTLLSVNDGFYQKYQIPKNPQEILESAKSELNILRYETEDGSKLQSVNDNEAGYTDMVAALGGNFETLQLDDRYAFFHEIIGGLRFDEKTNIQLARYLRDMDGILCKKGVLQATEFYFVGKAGSAIS